MSGRQFLVFEVPASETKVGAITQRRPGCRVDMVGRPLIREEGHAYLLHFLVTGIDADTRLEVLREMQRVYEEVETLTWRRDEGTWEVRGIIRIEQIDSRGLRFVAGLFGLVQAPWVLFEDGVASIRLFPREPHLMPSLAEAVDARLGRLGIGDRLRVEPFDLEIYRERAGSLGIRLA